MIGPQKILPVNSQPQSSGQGAKANGIVQTKQPQQNGAWVLCQDGNIYMNGLIVPSGGGLFQIVAPDASSNVTCVNGGQIYLNAGNYFQNCSYIQSSIGSGGMTVDSGGAINFTVQDESNINLNCNNGNISLNTDNIYLSGDSLVNIQTPQFSINNIPSSQYFIVYGESKGEANASEQYHTGFPDPDPSQPDLNIRMFGYPDFHEWFDFQNYNSIDNAYIQQNGNGFRFVCQAGTMVEIQITWQLRYTFDGSSYPSTYLCSGLYNVDENKIVPQSINWHELNDVKFKWVTFQSTFTMRTNDETYFPFFQNANNNQLTDTESGGLQRSSIKFNIEKTKVMNNPSTENSTYAVLAIQILTLITQFIMALVAQIHKNKLDQIHAQNESQSQKLNDIHKASSQSASPR